MLLQLLNPGFSNVVKVYHDPFARETLPIGVERVKIAGRDAKSYYLSIKENPSFRLKKKDYKKEFVPIWNSFLQIIEEFTDKSWADLVEHILSYSECNE